MFDELCAVARASTLLSPRWGFVFERVVVQGLTPLAIYLRRFAAEIELRRFAAEMELPLGLRLKCADED